MTFEDRGYECTEASGSLKPGCRRLLYCPTCDAPECVFGGLTFKQVQAGVEPPGEKKKKPISQRRRKMHSRAGKANAANQRAEGLTASGKPLKETCWNCHRLRKNLAGFVCEHRPLAEFTKWAARERRGCEGFGMRLVMEIPRLGGWSDG